MGTIVKAGGVRLLEVSKQYECQNSKCRFRFTVSVDLEQDNTLPQPRQCPSRCSIDHQIFKPNIFHIYCRIQYDYKLNFLIILIVMIDFLMIIEWL